jgi:glycosyltransferase involved in cell wall biosynthesis
MSERTRYTALVIQRRLTHYRIAFFEALRDELLRRDCNLRLAYGEPGPSELSKADSGILSWGEPLKTRYVIGERICWQPFRAKLAGVDISIITQENKLIYNLAAQYLYQRSRIALWGHGGNLQGDPSSLRECFKRVTSKQADWWFGYTDLSLPLIERTGFPRERITILNNTVDTIEFASAIGKVKPEALGRLRQDLELKNDRVGVYVGSLYEEKRIGFMLEAATQIHHHLPDFEFLILGSGPQKLMVEEFCAINDWAKYLGVRQGQAKADALALAQVMINPGLVGLTILDSFVSGVPMITTDWKGHSPEIAYLIDGYNGVITPNSLTDYVSAVSALLRDKSAIARLKIGCKVSAKKYTVENMARNFADGVMRCLTLPIYRG